MKRVVFSIALLAIVLLMAGPVSAGEGDDDPATTLRISITPTQGDPGTEISVTGSGAQAGIKVRLMIAPQADSSNDAVGLVEVEPASDGTFSGVVTVPSDLADGIYAVRAEQLNSNGNVIHYFWNAFTVGAGGDGPLLPTTGAIPGTPLTISAVLAVLLVMGLLIQGLRAAANRS
ncbi:MAG: hypothetical protein ACE5H9_00860 [Anaerolineae bacterium]